MSSEVFIRGIVAVFIGLAFTVANFSALRREAASDASHEGQRYTTFISSLILPSFVILLALFALPVYGFRPTAKMMLSLCFGIFLHIIIYYLILLIFLPVLRRFISARSCALLWLIPNYLYITHAGYMELPAPLIILRTPNNAVWILLTIWFIGFFLFFLRKILGHMLFRRRLLRDSRPVIGTEILNLWEQELSYARYKNRHIRLVRSSSTQTPLSIGFFKRSIRVVLPMKEYDLEELALIFRHELIHIGRQDSSTKFFMMFCTAMCWFNPLMWIAMRKSAEDLELSCDETVLLNRTDEERVNYANLILTTAGDQQGFTTCLAASPSALRYRLKNIVKPRRRYAGSILVGLAFFILCMTCGYVALAYDTTTGAEAIFKEVPEDYTLQFINWGEDGRYGGKTCKDTEALYTFLSDIPLMSMTGNYSLNEESPHFWAIFHHAEGNIAVYIHGNMLTLTHLSQDNAPQFDYYIDGDIDWSYLESLLESTYT